MGVSTACMCVWEHTVTGINEQGILQSFNAEGLGFLQAELSDETADWSADLSAQI